MRMEKDGGRKEGIGRRQKKNILSSAPSPACVTRFTWCKASIYRRLAGRPANCVPPKMSEIFQLQTSLRARVHPPTVPAAWIVPHACMHRAPRRCYAYFNLSLYPCVWPPGNACARRGTCGRAGVMVYVDTRTHAVDVMLPG